MNKIIFILLTATLVTTQVWAGSVTISNTFVDGTTASAGEVNNNFTTIKTAVNDNDTRITNDTANILTNTSNVSSNTTSIQNNASNIVLNAAGVKTNAGEISTNSTNIGINTADIASNIADTQTNATAISNIGAPRAVSVLVVGVRVGTFLQGKTINFLSDESTYYTLLDSGYIAGVQVQNSGVQLEGHDTRYTNADCTGQAYLNISSIGEHIGEQGVVYSLRQSGTPDLYYVPKGTAIEANITTQSYLTGVGTCTPDSNPDNKFKSYPNDSNVTGVTPADFVGTVTLGY